MLPITGAVITPPEQGPAPLAIVPTGGGGLPAISTILFTIPSPRGGFDVTFGISIVALLVVLLITAIILKLK